MVELSSLSASERTELKRNEDILQDWERWFVKAGIAILEIRDKKLYRESHETFEDYVKVRWGWSRARAYQLIDSAEVVESLPASQRPLIKNESQARALDAVKPENRSEVLKSVSKTGDFSARAITQMSTIVDKKQSSGRDGSQKREQEPEPPRDKTGYPIPDVLRARWEENNEAISKLMRHISEVRTAIKNAVEEVNKKSNGDGPTVWAPINLGDVTLNLDNAYRALKLGQPFAVCTFCQGRGFKSCTVCKQLGYLSKYIFEGPTVPDDHRKVRAKLCNK